MNYTLSINKKNGTILNKMLIFLNEMVFLLIINREIIKHYLLFQ